MGSRSNLLICKKQISNPSKRLFCFPYAGGGASVFSDWSNYLPGDIEVNAIQLPGRETRISEPLYSNIQEVLHELSYQIRNYIDIPFAFFGHSMGALLCFELTKTLRQEQLAAPDILFISSFRAPQLPDTDYPIHQLPDDKLVNELRKLGGTIDEFFQEPELMEMLLPVIRQDIGVCEKYEYKEERPLDCPIHVFGGINDKKVERDQLYEWKQQTSAEFDLSMLPGDHFFFRDQKFFVLDIILKKLLKIKNNQS